MPGGVAPLISQRIDHHAVAVNVAVLSTGGRVGHLQFAIDVEAVTGARRAPGLDHEPAIGLRQHRQRLAIFKFDTDVKRIRCPQRKLSVFGVLHDRAVGPVFLGP